MADPKTPPEWFKTHPLPDAQPMGKPIFAPLTLGYDVGAWCPTPDGSGKPEAVAMSIHVDGGLEVLLRLKSRAEVNRLVAVLLRHADDVWPEGKV